jgi:hypothetical protein
VTWHELTFKEWRRVLRVNGSPSRCRCSTRSPPARVNADSHAMVSAHHHRHHDQVSARATHAWEIVPVVDPLMIVEHLILDADS